MLGDLVKRIVNVAVLCIATATFFLVPIGRRTLSQHMVAIFTTPPAIECATACADAARRIVERAGAEMEAMRRAKKPAEGAPSNSGEAAEGDVEADGELQPAD